MGREAAAHNGVKPNMIVFCVVGIAFTHGAYASLCVCFMAPVSRRFVKLAPHNLRYETLNQHLSAAGITVGKQSLWDVPLVMTAGSGAHSSSGGGGTTGGGVNSCGGSSRGGSSCGGSMAGVEPAGNAAAAMLQQRQRPGASLPSSPHTHGGSGSAERRGGAAPPKPVLLLPPEDFFPFVVPFRWA
jgi:hypothetical protein